MHNLLPETNNCQAWISRRERMTTENISWSIISQKNVAGPQMILWVDSKGLVSTLRKHAYSNILKISPQKKPENFLDKNSDIFQISAQNIDCGYLLEPPRWGSSNEYPQSMFWSRNKNKNSAEGVIAPAGAKVTGATIRMWLLNKFISFLAVLTWKTGLKKM